MKGTSAIRAELTSFKENELIFASKLYREKLSEVVDEATYYKVLERMCKSGELVRIARGIYNLPKKSKYGIIPMSENEIIDAFTQNGKGTIVGNSLYNKIGLTTQIPKTIQVMSSALEVFSKTIQNVVVRKSGLKYDKDIENMVHVLDVLQNFNTIQDINYKAFVNFSREFAHNYSDTVFEQVLSEEKFKKSTISFLKNVLNYYGVSNNLDRYLSSMSKYSHPKMEEIYETARIN